MVDIFDKTDEEIERDVRHILSYRKGKENAISRWQLVEQVFGRAAALNRGNNNPYDRKIRDVIARYREQDLIVSSSGSAGYYLAADMGDIETIASELEGRAKDMLTKASHLRRRGLEAFGPQLDLFGKPN